MLADGLLWRVPIIYQAGVTPVRGAVTASTQIGFLGFNNPVLAARIIQVQFHTFVPKPPVAPLPGPGSFPSVSVEVVMVHMADCIITD